MSYYIEYEHVKKKLRIPDDTLKEEIMLYIQEVDDLINNRLRARLGFFDSNGDSITLPLTVTTRPALDEELKAIGADLVEGKFIFKQSEKDIKWNTAVKSLDNYLDQRFGWVHHGKFRQNFTISISPRTGVVSTTVTVSGTSWPKFIEIKIFIGGFQVATTPTQVLTDTNGDFTATFSVPTSLATGTQTIRVTDETLTGIEQRFVVTS